MKKRFAVIIWLILLSAVTVSGQSKSLDELKAAFARDDYDVVKTVEFQGQRGLMALHRTAVNYETKKQKKAFYVEGNAYQMGYLIGLLAPEDTERMATEFVDHVIFDLIKVNVDPKEIPIIWGIIKEMLIDGSKKILPDIPKEYIEEMNGLVDGCKKANPDSKVDFNSLLLLNVGFDAILSNIYALNKSRETRLDPKKLTVPVMCNAFSVFGKATIDGKHYFGRDFMFPTAGVFEFVACMTIYCPNDGRSPMVAVSAPGFVGCIAGMNKQKVGTGIDMVPGNNCNPSRPGLNSLVLLRHATHQGRSAQQAVNAIVEAQRGVTWLFFIADGTNDRSVVVESGMTTDNLDPLSYVPEELNWFTMLPDKAFLERYETEKHQKGVMLRWNDYKHPQEFFRFNNDLFEYHEKKQSSKSWGERGYINRSKAEQNCPKSHYFAPQRENRDDVLLISNHALTPSARLCGMNPWTVMVSEHKYDDIQWRYDELNNQILDAYGKIDEKKAVELIDFLAPYNKFPEYYKNNKKSTDGKTQRIRGSVSLFNLTDQVVHTKYGYYGDQWITITLSHYID